MKKNMVFSCMAWVCKHNIKETFLCGHPRGEVVLTGAVSGGGVECESYEFDPERDNFECLEDKPNDQ